jgi:NAD(P)-dependent dehydrogenase (short-subunit alcohol dehydrogenase family)
LGGAVHRALCDADVLTFGTSRQPAADLLHLDLTDEASIAACATRLGAQEAPLRLVFVATGLLYDDNLQPEKNLRQLDPARLARSFAINTIGPALLAKHLIPLLPRTGKSIFAALSARVGSISDNRLGGWYGYRASKAALNQVLRTAAVEAQRMRPEAVVVALHPGTVETRLSAPFRGDVRPERLFSAEQAASQLLDVLDRLTAADSGGFFAFDGSPIAY